MDLKSEALTLSMNPGWSGFSLQLPVAALNRELTLPFVLRPNSFQALNRPICQDDGRNGHFTHSLYPVSAMPPIGPRLVASVGSTTDDSYEDKSVSAFTPPFAPNCSFPVETHALSRTAVPEGRYREARV